MSRKEFPYYCELTFRTEGGKLPIVRRPHCPGNDSGVTIGPGYDMKERESDDVARDLMSAGVPSNTAEELAGGVGKKGDVARQWILAKFPGREPVITEEASRLLFEHVYPGYAELVRKKIVEDWKADWNALPRKVQEVLVDLAFRGDICRFKGTKTRHEALIKPLVASNDHAGFCSLIADYEYWHQNANLARGKDGEPNARYVERARWLGAEGVSPRRESKASFPFDLGGGSAATEENAARFYEHTEVTNKGGYFPIGVNTVWHGGIHLRARRGTPIRAVWDGKIVAARLPDDPGMAEHHYGSANFILLEHEIGGAILNKMAPLGKLIGFRVKIPHVNLRKAPSIGGDKVIVLDANDELRLLSETMISADGYQWAHVELKKAALSAKFAAVGKQGYIATRPYSNWYYPVRENGAARRLDERRVYRFFSLYMHLNVERLDGSSRALDNVSWLRAPVTSSSEVLSAPVGQACANKPADVRKVQIRLGEHEVRREPPSGICDAATVAAIRAFQERLRQSGVLRTVDGRIMPAGPTWAALRRPMKRKLDETLVSSLRQGGVVKVDKSVQGGDVIWTSGEYGSPGYRGELIHWEIFSEENLIPGWTEVEDPDNDFNMDCPTIMKLIQQDDSWWADDEILTFDEVVRFYSSHHNARLLRHYACKFVSEWGVDLDVAIPKMLNANIVSTFGLKAHMAPYLWWNEAHKKNVPIPSTPKCWHYNPIAFTSALSAATRVRVAADAPPAEAATSPTTTPSPPGEHVFVERNQQRVPHFRQADPAWGARILGNSATIAAKGCAISSVAMILKYYGRDVSPLSLDEYLDQHDGYSGDSVKWDVALKCAETAELKFGVRTVVTSGFKAALDARIAANKPTLARVDYANDEDGNYNHFVVIVGRHKDGHYIMNDPASSGGNGASNPSPDNLIEKTTRKGGYTLVQLDLFDPT